MKFSENDFSLPPFPGFPSTKRYVPLGPVSEAVSRVTRSVFAREAISLVIGPPGTGKSLTSALLTAELSDAFDIVSLGETQIDCVKTFYRLLLHRLGVPTEAGTSTSLELMIHDRLCGSGAHDNGTVVLIDEAASLSSEVLEAVRGITNLMRDGRPMVSAVVLGGPRLDDTLANPRMEPFVQRISARCYLHPLNGDETRDYVRQSIQACNASAEETISDAALSSIHHASGGVPRLINQLMTEAIDCAAEQSLTAIDECIVDQAWAQLQQLPSPITEEPRLEPSDSAVEFGELLPDSNSDSTAPAPAVFEPVSSHFDHDDEVLPHAFQTPVTDPTPLDLAPVSPATLEPIPTQAASPIPEFSPLPPSANELLSLFGEFDEEERIPVGGGLESTPMLDQEARRTVDSDHFVEIEAESIPEVMPMESSPVGERQTVPGILWYDEPVEDLNQEETRDDSDLLWIAEDIDVERRIDTAAAGPAPHFPIVPVPPGEVSLDVDYRAMLQKMRHHS